ncbi:MAG: TlpA disulfide reductase family protein [Verrucomicrobia bacterium]|jgi:thiol-disulfide isomerase/thioredoxin|nr:TlpA disulfide reductase family protein [Verrucomicrobiota bacterium]
MKNTIKKYLTMSAICGLLAMPSCAVSDEADVLWKQVEEAGQLKPAPADWQTNRPSQEEVEKFIEENGAQAFKAAKLAKEFYTKHPDHAKAEEARTSEKEHLQKALQEYGYVEAAPELLKLDLPVAEKFQVRSIMIQNQAMAKQAEGREAVLLEFEKGVRELTKEFPDNEEIPQMLMYIAEQLGGKKGIEIAKEVSENAKNEQIKAAARGLAERLGMWGSKLDLKFTAVDGREVDLQKMNGKVVLIDFWATWCGPCIQELPNVKAAYESLHPKGFEIIGISFDQSEGKLTSFTKKENMPWPQYFDGQGWQNAFGQRFGITAVPTMWLVNKKGELVEAIEHTERHLLKDKIEALLAEKTEG